MSEQQPNASKGASNSQTIIFMVVLSFVCALILSVLASALEEPKEIAKDLDRSKQMMISAKILTHEGYFLIKDDKGEYVPAKYAGNGKLEAGSINDIASSSELIDVYKARLKPVLVDSKGEITTFQKTGINEDDYIAKFKKSGYYKQPYKLVYEILPNGGGDKVEGYVVPVNGFGLWDAIYGYLALETDGNTIIGISWYDQKETPGLGANIAEAYWQNLFPGKKIFQGNADGKIDYALAPLGIVVVKGKVAEVYGTSPKANSAVDGMAGATLTGNGVTDAYRDVLAAYRPFFIKLQGSENKNQKS